MFGTQDMDRKDQQKILRGRVPSISPGRVKKKKKRSQIPLTKGPGPSPLRFDWFSFDNQRETYEERLRDAREELLLADSNHIGVADESTRQCYEERRRKAHAKVVALEAEKVKKMMEWIPRKDQCIFREVILPGKVAQLVERFRREPEGDWMEKIINEEEEVFAEGADIDKAATDMMAIEHIEQKEETMTQEKPFCFLVGMEIRRLREIAADFWQIPPHVSEHEYHFLVQDNHAEMYGYPDF